jgi:hypothetical protein
MDYVDHLLDVRKEIEEEIAIVVDGRIAEAIRKKFPSRKMRPWIRGMFGLFATICLALAFYAVTMR